MWIYQIMHAKDKQRADQHDSLWHDSYAAQNTASETLETASSSR